MRSIFRNAFRRQGRGRCAARADTYEKGGRQMRSIFNMPSDDRAGDAARRVPIPYRKERGKESPEEL